MATLGSLVVSLECSAAKFEQGMNRAEYIAKQKSDNIKNAMTGIGTALAGAISIAKLESMFKGIMDIESAALKMANRLGTSVEVLSSFGSMARKTGMDSETFYQTLTRLEKGISAAAKGAETSTGKFDENGEEILKTASAYNELGLKAEILNKLPLDQKLMEIAAAFKANIAPEDQVRVAMELGGKSAAGMVNILREGPEAIAKLMARQRELGVITTEGATEASKFKGAVADLGAAFNDFTRQLADSVDPPITNFITKLTDAYLFAKDIAKRLRDLGNAPMAPGIAAGTLGGRIFGEGKGEGGFVSGGAGGGGSGGGWGAEPGDPFVPTAGIRKPPVRPGDIVKAGKGGGGSSDMGLDRMSTIVDTLTKDLAKLTEGSLAEITAWGTHMRSEIEKVGAKGADMEVALGLQKKLETAKKIKAEEDYNLFVAKESGDTYAQIDAQGKADLDKYKGFATAKAVTDAATARKKLEEQAKNNEEVWGLQKNVLDSLSSLTPVISEQNYLKKKSLDLEIAISKSTLDQKLAKLELSHVISKAQADEFRGLQAIEAQAKRTNLAIEQDRGLKGWAAQRVKSESQTNTWADAMEGLESYVNDAWTQGVQGALSKTKVDYMEVAKTMAVSFMLNLGKQGIHKIFNTVAEAIAGGGIGKLGTDANPMVVTIKGMNIKGLGGGADFERTAKKAGKVGYSMGGSKGGQDDFAFTDQYFKDLQKGETKFDKVFTNDLKDWNKQFKILTKTGDTYSDLQGDWAKDNQEAFKTEYLGQYQTDFTGMVGGMTSIWSVGQGLMTAAGVSGDAQRIASMASFGLQGITLLSNFANSAVLIDAKKSAAAAYAWVVEMVPPPLGFVLGAVAAAAAFAGTMALGKSSAGGDYQVGGTDLRMVHQDETILPAWAAKSWRDIVSRGAMPGGGPGEGGRDGGVHFHPGAITIDARGASKDINWGHVVKRQIIPELDKALGKRGYQKIGGGR